jgi:hypothetical protein
MAAGQGEEGNDTNYVYILNNTGTVLVYNSLVSEQVSGFSLWTNGGLFIHEDVAVVNDQVFFLTSDQFIVRVNNDRVTDFGIKKATPGSGVFTGLTHLNGQTVQIVGDDAFEGTAVVSGGQVNVDPTKTNTEVGLEFNPVIETMPLNQALQNGPNFAEPKKVNRVTVDFQDSLGIVIKNSLGYEVRIADKTMAVDVFDTPTPHSGREDVWLLGWDNVASVTITQDTPVPMIILALAVEVGVQ